MNITQLRSRQTGFLWIVSHIAIVAIQIVIWILKRCPEVLQNLAKNCWLFWEQSKASDVLLLYYWLVTILPEKHGECIIQKAGLVQEPVCQLFNPNNYDAWVLWLMDLRFLILTRIELLESHR